MYDSSSPYIQNIDQKIIGRGRRKKHDLATAGTLAVKQSTMGTEATPIVGRGYGEREGGSEGGGDDDNERGRNRDGDGGTYGNNHNFSTATAPFAKKMEGAPSLGIASNGVGRK